MRLRNAANEKGHRTLYTARMNPLQRSISLAIAASMVALSLALSGCGNKGPLVLAADVPADTPVPAAESAPPAQPDATPPATAPPAAEDPAAKPAR
jgi:predicted small lipoprotein YifL